jgi:hypothetical protein
LLAPHAAAVRHAAGRMRLAAPDGANLTEVSEWFDLEEANEAPQADLLLSRRGLVGASRDLEGRLLDIQVEPWQRQQQQRSGDGAQRPAQAAPVRLGPWVGVWPLLLERRGAPAVYDPAAGLQQPGFIQGRNKLWRLEVRAAAAAAAPTPPASLPEPAAAAAGQKQQQAGAGGSGRSSKQQAAVVSWSVVAGAGGGAAADSQLPVLALEDFPSLNEVMGGGAAAVGNSSSSNGGKGAAAPAVAVEREGQGAQVAHGQTGQRQAVFEAAWAALPNPSQQRSAGRVGGARGAAASGRGRGSSGGGGGGRGRQEATGELLATLWIGEAGAPALPAGPPACVRTSHPS